MKALIKAIRALWCRITRRRPTVSGQTPPSDLD
jgi:hypothetical protein